MEEGKTRLKRIEDFHEQNPNFDFYDRENLQRLNSGELNSCDINELKIYHRLLRIVKTLDPDRAMELAERLRLAGLDSAHKIAQMSEHRFVTEYAHLFGNDEEMAVKAHQNAVAVKTQIQHAYANIHGAVASPHFKSMLANNIDNALVDYFAGLPNYQELFGKLDYIKGDHTSSIFSPAAYFLDLMRITDEYITYPNTKSIPDGFKLQDRRPDLFEIKLNCKNTNDPLPILQIVNSILERRIGQELQVASGTAQAGSASSERPDKAPTITLAADDPAPDDFYNDMTIMITGGTGVTQLRTIIDYAASSKVAAVNEKWDVVPDRTSKYIIAKNAYMPLAAALYPFNLPFHLPLVQIRKLINSMGLTLPQVLTAFNNPITGGTAKGGTEDTIELDNASTVEGFYNTMQVILIGGTGAGQVRTITAYEGGAKKATVDKKWKIIPDSTTQYQIIDSFGSDREYLGLSIEQYNNLTTIQDTDSKLWPFFGYVTCDINEMAKVETFLARTGLSHDQLNELLTQNLSSQELKSNLPMAFFINNTKEDKPFMQIVIDDSDKNNPFYKIANLTIKRLDRMNRFIRLAVALNWSFADLDWAMASVTAEEITEKTIKAISGIKRLQDLTSLEVDRICSFWHPLKTKGKGSGPNPQDLFDRVFNNPALLDGKDPYTSTEVIPFDTTSAERCLEWKISDTKGQSAIIRGRLMGALKISNNDLTELGRYVISLTGATGDSLKMTLENLTWLYRLSAGAAIFKLTVDEYLVLMGLMYYPDSPYLQPPSGSLAFTVTDVMKQMETVNWFNRIPFNVYETLYILQGEQSISFSPVYKTGDIAPFIDNLAAISEGARLKDNSFIYGNIDTSWSKKIFTDLVDNKFLTGIGIILDDGKSYQSAAGKFPIAENSFKTRTITEEESKLAYYDLQKCHPPVLLGQNQGFSTLSHSFDQNTDLDFLFKGIAQADNKRNEVRSILLNTRDKIHLTEFAFLFPFDENSFITDNITPAESQRVLADLKNNKVIVEAAQLQKLVLSAAFAQNTPLDFLFKSAGSGQSRTITAYDGSTKTAIVEKNWDTIPNTTSIYRINCSISGTAQKGTDYSIILDTIASADKDAYNGMTVEITDGTGKGQKNIITQYDGTTKTARVSAKWNIIPDHTSVYGIKGIMNQGTALGGDTNRIKLAGGASSTTDQYQGMTISIIPDPLADLKSSEVKQMLLDVRQNIIHVSDVIDGAENLQESNAMQGLASFLKTTPDILEGIIPFAARSAEISNYLDELLTPLNNGQVPLNIPPFMDVLARALLLFEKLTFGINDIYAVVDTPGAFNIADTTKISLENIFSLAEYKKLTSEFDDRNNSLAGYLSLPEDKVLPGPKVAALSSLTHWNTDQICCLIKLFWPDNEGKSQFDYQTIPGLSRLMQCFAFSSKTGMDIQLLLELNKTSNLPIVDASGGIISTNWSTYHSLAGTVLGAVNAKFQGDKAEIANSEITVYMDTQKRNALLGYAVWTLNKKIKSMQKPSDLYQYLLVDVEMSDCDAVSLIAQGIASVQLYMQRCRMMLEPGVTDLANIPDIWWEWMSSYRIWEANRKVFLYPENYIEPALRKNQTDQFKKFAESLLQTNIDDKSVSDAFNNYFQDVSEVAGLVHCAGYNCKITKPGMKDPVDTYFLFGRTNTQPYTYYFRQFDNKNRWTMWKKIGISINSMFISPVYAFKKLFIFWAEVDTAANSKVMAGQATPVGTSTAKLKYSYLNTDGTWIEPQTFQSEVTVNYSENYKLDKYLSLLPPGLPEKYDPTLVFWRKVYPLHVPEQSLKIPDKYPNGENVFLNYGYGMRFTNMKVPGFDPPPVEQPANQYAIEKSAYDLVTRFNNIVAAAIPNVNGYVQNVKSICLDTGLNAGKLNTVFINTPYPQPYYPFLDRLNTKLGINKSFSYNVIIDNYYADDHAQIQLPAPGNEDKNLLINISGQNASIITAKNLPGSFIFDNGDEAFLAVSQERGIHNISDILHASAKYFKFPDSEFYFYLEPYTETPMPFDSIQFKFYRISTSVLNKLKQRLILGGVDNLLSIESQRTKELPFSRLLPQPNVVIAPQTDDLDFNGAYGMYFWEIFFHAPYLIADTLNINKRFEDAKRWFQYIFNPTQQPETGTTNPSERYWRFLPFRSMTKETLVQILTNPQQIQAYNDDPFDPDAIARLRISAYAKSIVMKYIDNILDWADFLFTQDTRETITQATNLYIMASDLLGQRPEALGEFPEPDPRSFNDIKEEYNNKTIAAGTAQAGAAASITLAANASDEKDAYTGMYIRITAGTGSNQQAYIIAYEGSTRVAAVEAEWGTIPDNTSQYEIFVDGIPQFLIRLENTGLIAILDGTAPQHTPVVFNDINSYFYVPENSELTAYWDRVEDRLFKIRHGMNIKGEVRSLAMFEPPIDVRQLIRAAAAGGGSLSLMSRLDVQIPYYRFALMIEKAKSLAGGVMQLGNSLLGALEKNDAEAVALLRASQEKAILNMTTFIKEQQINELVEINSSLNESLNSATRRYDYYTDLLAKGLSPGEIINIVSTTLGMICNVAAGVTRTLASVGYAVPQGGSPFAMTYGGQQIGAVLTAASGAFEIGAGISNYIAQLSLTLAGYQRRAEEWQLQSDLAGFDRKQITDQIEANQIRQEISKRELEIHKTSIRQNQEMEDFLANKFTNKELYQWMVGRISTVYFQTYALAFDLARAAQRAYQFELNSDQSFINFGYWDNLKKGLLAGEGLMLALNQMEKTYMENNARSLEIEKTISLIQLNPKALIDLRTNGECIFELPERLFDGDYPGNYARKIKTISVSIPAVVGPYQNIKATLTQLSNQVIVKPDINAVNFLLGGADTTTPGTDVLRSNWWVNQQIAISKGVDDSGMFQLNFNDERYLPFEGTGAVSSWRLSMPKATNLINFDAISDVIIQLKYTAADGGDEFRKKVNALDAMKPYYGSNFFMLAQSFSQQWYTFLHDHADPKKQEIQIELLNLVPLQIKNSRLTGFYFKLDVPQGTKTTAGKNYIHFNSTDQVTIDFDLDSNNSFLYNCKTPPDLSSVEGKRTVFFDLNDVPPGLKDKTGFLDPGMVRNIVLILFFQGERL